jgi:hypothetical protein
VLKSTVQHSQQRLSNLFCLIQVRTAASHTAKATLLVL